MDLSPHFTLEEFVASQTASRENISNVPGLDIIVNLKNTAQVLEKVRALGLPKSGAPNRRQLRCRSTCSPARQDRRRAFKGPKDLSRVQETGNQVTCRSAKSE
jgi:hypothetical protein